ncbi:MAG: hypothetical protein NE328_18910 [Lentisphaeraceae bacterium]|nr:hypothetical protein [Lentisphaeraceae bacterium]
MFRLFLFLFIPLIALKAEDVSTVRYELSPFAVDLILNWEDMSKFPYKRHFMWENEPFNFSNFNQARMRKGYSRFKKPALKEALTRVLAKVGLSDKNSHFDISYHELDPRLGEGYYLYDISLLLTTSEKVHIFFEWVNSYHHNVKGNTFSNSYRSPVVSAKYTILSMPVELVRKKGLDFFPGGDSKSSFGKSNEEFNDTLKELKKEKGVSVVGEYLCRAVSGKTMVIRDVKSYLYPEYYFYIGEKVTGRHFDEKTQKWTATQQLVNISGIGPAFGEPRDVGNVIEFTPQVEPNGRYVSIDLKMNFLKHLGWTEYDDQEDIRMPVLQSLSTETRLTSVIGETRPISVLYYKNRTENFKQSVREEDLKNEILDKCILVYVSLETVKKGSALQSNDDEWTFYMTPVGSLAKSAFANLPGNDKKADEKVKALLIDMGMKFSEGSFLHYNPDYSVVTTFNKVSEVKKLLNFLPKKVVNRTRTYDWYEDNMIASNLVLEITNETAANIGIENKSDILQPNVLKKLLTLPFDGKGSSIVSVSSFTGMNGNTSYTRDAIEMYSPESFEYEKAGGKPLYMPNFGDPTDLGNTVEKTAQMDPDGRTVELEIKLNSTDVTGWLEFKKKKTAAILKEKTTDTRVVGKMGETLLNSYEAANGRITINLSIYKFNYLERR